MKVALEVEKGIKILQQVHDVVLLVLLHVCFFHPALVLRRLYCYLHFQQFLHTAAFVEQQQHLSDSSAARSLLQ